MTSAVLPFGGERHAIAEERFPIFAAAAVSFAPCWVQVAPERVNTHAAPTPLSPAADQRGVAVGGERGADAEEARRALLPRSCE